MLSVRPSVRDIIQIRQASKEAGKQAGKQAGSLRVTLIKPLKGNP